MRDSEGGGPRAARESDGREQREILRAGAVRESEGRERRDGLRREGREQREIPMAEILNIK